MLVRQLDFVGLTVWWGTTVRSYSLLRDNCKILQFFQSTDSFFWQLSMAHWQLSHWQLSDLTVVRSDSCLIWQLSALTVVRSDSCPILQMSDLTANIWQLSPNPESGRLETSLILNGTLFLRIFQAVTYSASSPLMSSFCFFSLPNTLGMSFFKLEMM